MRCNYKLKSLLSVLAFAMIDSAMASNFQVFSGINYSNPAELIYSVKNFQMILGSDWVDPNLDFTGNVTVEDPLGLNNVETSGSAANDSSFFIPYGRIAKRLNEQWVVGLDITEPFIQNTSYPSDSILRYAATTSRINSLDIAPNIAFQFPGALSNLSLGVGVDALQFSATLDQNYPSFPVFIPPRTLIPFGSGEDIFVGNKASDWAYGWHAGGVYHLFKGTFLGASYFSEITPTLTGTSSFTNYADNTNLTSTLTLPATSNFSLTQFFSEDWFVQAIAHWTQWSSIQELVLNNTAGPSSEATIPTNYRNTWRFELGSRYGLTQRWIFGGLLAYDQTPTNDTDRTVRLPEEDTITLGGSIEYKVTKQLGVKANYYHVFMVSSAPINQTNTDSNTTVEGSEDASANVVGLRVTWDVS